MPLRSERKQSHRRTACRIYGRAAGLPRGLCIPPARLALASGRAARCLLRGAGGRSRCTALLDAGEGKEAWQREARGEPEEGTRRAEARAAWLLRERGHGGRPACERAAEAGSSAERRSDPIAPPTKPKPRSATER